MHGWTPLQLSSSGSGGVVGAAERPVIAFADFDQLGSNRGATPPPAHGS